MNKKHYFETKNSIYSYTMKDAIINRIQNSLKGL